MQVIDSSCTWFFYNLNTKYCYSQITYNDTMYISGCVQQHFFSVSSSLVPPPTLFNSPFCPICFPCLLTWRFLFLCSWCEYLSTLVPGQISTVLPLLLNPPRRHPTDQVTYLHRRHQQHQPSRLCVVFTTSIVFGLSVEKELYETSQVFSFPATQPTPPSQHFQTSARDHHRVHF